MHAMLNRLGQGNHVCPRSFDGDDPARFAVKSSEDRSHSVVFNPACNVKRFVESLTNLKFAAQALNTLRDQPLNSR